MISELWLVKISYTAETLAIRLSLANSYHFC
jgi:hypothetical protein